jgi:aconitate decarboxylase
MIKRMQHGFAARNGLYAAVLAQGGYVGIKRVFEREYGGFLGVFSEGHDPDASQITAGLGSRWITTEIAIKPYSAMAAVHGAIDCCLKIREGGVGADQVKTILVEVGDAAFQHGGFEIKRPIQPITAQMSLRYSVAVALLDGGALVPQFSNKRINQDDVWSLLDRVEIRHQASFDKQPHSTYATRVTVTDKNGAEHKLMLEAPHGGEGNLLTNAEIVKKFESLNSDLMEAGRSHRIRDFVLGIETNRAWAPCSIS